MLATKALKSQGLHMHENLFLNWSLIMDRLKAIYLCALKVRHYTFYVFLYIVHNPQS